MKTRHARQIRLGILAARRDMGGGGIYSRALPNLTGLGHAAYIRQWNKREPHNIRAWRELLGRPYTPAETFTHTRAPNHATGAADKHTQTQEGQQ